jgi:predicted N-formylglutamate amidohydrolase
MVSTPVTTHQRGPMQHDLPLGDPPSATVLNADGAGRIVLVCEHASNFVPARYERLGLPVAELERHIAFDIGVKPITEMLATMIDAPAILSGYSRLLIDNNRPLFSPESIPTISELTRIPGNEGIAEDEVRFRQATYFEPFQQAVRAVLDQRLAKGRPTIVFGLHSFTPVFKGHVRPWHVGVLFDRAKRFSNALMRHLEEDGRVVAANEPYRIEEGFDYTVPVHGTARGLDAALIEIRQDLITTAAQQETWAKLIARALTKTAQDLDAR